ncbi:MAG TPA: VWA domain-containing protein [Pyrinomonadaceae bacterium]|jgi:VWFA-related protein|nr:VWA domain-containing protein [Pyrinomonadaceae bacterium]
MKPLKFGAPVLLGLAIFAFAVAGQTPDKDDQPIKVSTLLLNIPVIASDAHGRYVSGLKKENFSIIQDGEKQEIEFFADDKAPMNVVILIDFSGSTMPFLAGIKQAARDFVKILRPEDQGMIATFSDDMRVCQAFTSDQKKLDRAIRSADLQSPGGSNMQDAMYDIVTKGFAGIEGRKAIIVLTDGFVSGRLVTDKALLQNLSASDILIYPILFGDRKISIPLLPRMLGKEKEITREEAIQRIVDEANSQLRFMDKLALVTGGKRIDAKSTDFKVAFQDIADELKNLYLVGFYPQITDTAKLHNITLKVEPSDISIRTKSSFKLRSSPTGN